MRYFIYDQFHWLRPDHIELSYDTWDEALEAYNFMKQAHPSESLGLTDETWFNRIKESIRPSACQHCGRTQTN